MCTCRRTCGFSTNMCVMERLWHEGERTAQRTMVKVIETVRGFYIARIAFPRGSENFPF